MIRGKAARLTFATANALVTLAVGAAIAQPAASMRPANPPAPSAALPPGHPPISAAAEEPSALPPGHPPVAEPPVSDTGALPEGHPPVDQGDGEPGARPGRAMAPQPPADTSEPSPALPAGTIEAKIVDPSGAPLAGMPVRVGILRTSIAQGEARDSRTSTTSADGRARFDGLAQGSDYSYRVTVAHDGATYAVTPFNLGRDIGHLITLHVFPVTGDIARALVGMRAFMHVEPRDEVFQFEVLFQIFNIGTVTWVPSDVHLELPRGFKAFNAQESMSDTRVTADGEDVKLQGTFGPGQQEIAFRFQVTNDHDETSSFRMSLPPHVAELRVSAAASPGMTLSVDGFDAAKSATTETGQRVLVTSRQLGQGDTELHEVAMTLAGLPTPGPSRWIAVALAAAFAAGGIASARSAHMARTARTRPRALSADDVAGAREALLDEIIELERARRDERVGPRTYETARRTLFEALARLQTAEHAG